jgi:uncharacterized protein YraI
MRTKLSPEAFTKERTSFPLRSTLQLIGLLALTLLVAGCLPVVAIETTPEPILVPVEVPVIAVAPASGPPGTSVAVSGAGWDEDEVVYVKLEALVGDVTSDATQVGDAAVEELTVAVVTADENGRFDASFLYPLEGFWAEQTDVVIIATSLKRESPATAAFVVTTGPVMTGTPEPTATATPTAVPTVAATPVKATPTRVPGAANIATVTSAALNLRSGPSSSYAILRTLSNGDRLTVLGQSPNAYWLLVRTTDGLEGWVARPYTDFTAQAPIVSVTQPTPYPTPTQTPVPSQVWYGEYFANKDLAGTPVLVRNDSSINFDWGYGSPGAGVPSDYFSARWTQNIYFSGGNYRFYASVDDGVRIFIDGQPLIDEWRLASDYTYSADRYLDAGNHTVRVEYFENTGIAKINVWWEALGTEGTANWRGEYYNNRFLAGTPVVIRDDANIDFNWGYGSPAAGIGSDNFSVRWTRSVYFEEGLYRFTGRYDDGMRAYVNGQTIIDDWTDGSSRSRSGEIYLSRGYHSLQVNYYENTGYAEASFGWVRLDDTPTSFPDWKGEYWTNRHLSGSPRVVRNDRHVDFNWGTGSPDPRIPNDDFSARWTRKIDFDDGWYRFSVRSDDGVRVWVGGDRIIDEWYDQRGDRVHSAEIYLDGDERVKIEYYERTGGALIDFWYERVSSPTPTPTHTPTQTVTPTPTNTPTPTPTPDLPTQPYVEARPSRGTGGTEVTLTGGGFPARTTLTVYLGAPVQAQALERSSANRYATTITDDDGDFAVAFPMPDEWPDGTPIASGQLLIMVATDDFIVSASTLFDYEAGEPPVITEPSAVVDPSRGGPGTSVTVSGGGFPAGARVNIHLAGVVTAQSMSGAPVVYASTTARSDGTFDVGFTMPATWPNGSTIESGKLAVLAATDNFAIEATTLFDYFVQRPNPSISAQPLFGGPGTQVQVTGGGFPANTDVNVLLATLDEQVGAGRNPAIYASATTDRTGGYSMTFSMPSTWPDGTPIQNEELVIVVATYDYSVRVSTVDYIPDVVEPPDPEPTPEPPPAQSPSAGVSPGSGTPGTSVTVSGGGFPANANLTVFLARFDDSGGSGQPERFATTTSNGSGDYLVTFSVPNQWPDGSAVENGRLLVLVATNDFQHEAGASFEVTGVASADVREQPDDLQPSAPKQEDEGKQPGGGTIPPAPRD